jgi:SSS family solute:Na+ symporter/sodium/proline symporter
MPQQAVIWVTIAAYIIITAVIGIVNNKKAKNISDFTVGDRNASAWMSAFSYGTAYFSAVMFIGYAGGTGWSFGLWGIAAGIGNAVFGSLLAWMVLARRTREFTRANEIKSMPQLFGKRFDSPAMSLFSTIVIFIFLLPYSASVYKGLTSVCSVLLKVDERVCMIVIALAAAAVVIAGGYMATLKADFFQGILMLGGVVALIVCIMRADQVGGFSEGLERISEKTSALNLTTNDHISSGQPC